MASIIWVLLLGPPCLAALIWLLTRGWTLLMMRGRPTPRIAMWQRYDFWIILAILYIVMFAAALVRHKL
jgi:hypothetical protein